MHPLDEDTGPHPVYAGPAQRRQEDQQTWIDRALSFVGHTWERFIDTQPYVTGYALARFVASASSVLWGLAVIFEHNGIAYSSARGLRALGVDEDVLGASVLLVGGIQLVRLIMKDVPRGWEYLANGMIFLFWTYSLLGTFLYASPPNALGVATTPFIWWFAWWNMFARPR